MAEVTVFASSDHFQSMTYEAKKVHWNQRDTVDTIDTWFSTLTAVMTPGGTNHEELGNRNIPTWICSLLGF